MPIRISELPEILTSVGNNSNLEFAVVDVANNITKKVNISRIVTEFEQDRVLYVSTSGKDTNDGKSITSSLASIKKACEIALQNRINAIANNVSIANTYSTTIFVRSGEYLENNPITVPQKVAIVGDDLRTVTVTPANKTTDLFWVTDSSHLSNMTFKDHLTPAAAVAFPATGAGFISTSPFVQNCMSSTTTGSGVKIDGNLADSNSLKSIKIDSFTAFNQNGIGVHVVNNGYAHITSLSTICCYYGVLCENGGHCVESDSKTSYGDFGLVANGAITLTNYGTPETLNETYGGNVVIGGLIQKPKINDVLRFQGDSNYYTITNVSNLVSNQVTLSFAENLPGVIPASTPVTFYHRSLIISSSHTFEYTGSGTSLFGGVGYAGSCLPQFGGIPDKQKEVVQNNGGAVFFNGIDHLGNYNIGEEFSIDNGLGLIKGKTFTRSVFSIMAPYILALE